MTYFNYPKSMWFLLVVALIAWTSCAEHPQHAARGARTVDELLDAYRRAHLNDDITLLHDYLLWRAPNWGMRGSEEREYGIARLFALNLKKIVYAEMLEPNFAGGTVRYMYSGVMPDGTFADERYSVIGLQQGRILLQGYTRGRSITVDPVIVIRPYQGRYYFYTSHPILGEAADAIEEGRPQTSKAHPNDNEVFHVWWEEGNDE